MRSRNGTKRRRACWVASIVVLQFMISDSAGAEPTKGPGRLTAIIHPTAGDLKCELFPDKAPNTVANFVGLATGKKGWTNPRTRTVEHNRPFYDGVIFHRAIPGFMIQGEIGRASVGKECRSRWSPYH